MLKGRTKRFLQIISVLLTFAVFTGTFTAVAEAVENYNTTHVWLITDNLTETEYSDNIFNRYEDKNFETNTAEIFTYNESGEVDYTYSLSGSVGDATASLDLNFWHNTNDLGNAPYDSAVADGSETFLTETDGTNFMNSVYGFGIGWSLDIPQIEYINSTTAYFHNGEGKAYRIGAVTPETEGEEITYKLCGFPYDYTIEKNITFENEEDTEGTLQGFIGTDRYGNKDYFNRDGRFIKSQNASGTVLSTVAYNEDNLISTYSGEDYTLNFVRTEAEDETEEITVNMSSNIEETDEDGNTTTTTETETIHTFTIIDNQLVSVYEGEKDADPEITTETDEENGVTITTTDTSENSVAFEYEAETSAILLDSEVDTIESDLSGMDLLLLKKVTVNSESSTAENYEAIDETNETAVAYATEQNETALNEETSNTDVSDFVYEKGYKEIGDQSYRRYPRLGNYTKTETKTATGKEDETTLIEISTVYSEDDLITNVNTDRNGKESEKLVYSYSWDAENNFKVYASYTVDYRNCSFIPFDQYFGISNSSEWQEAAYETTKNQRGETIKYRYKDGPYYYYTYDSKGDVIKSEFDNYTINYNEDGQITSFLLGDTPLTSYTYGSTINPNLVTATAYANGQNVSNTYDDKGNLLTISCGNSQRYTFTYDEEDNVTSVTDILNFRRTEYVESVIEETDTPSEETEEQTESATDGEETATEEESVTKRTAYVYDISNAESPVLMYSYDVEGDTQNITLDSLSLNFSTETEDVLDEEGEVESVKTTSTLQNGSQSFQNENTTTPSGTLIGTVVKNGDTVISSKTYEYNSKTQVISENNGEVTYGYGVNGNLETITEGNIYLAFYYEIGGQNKLLKATDNLYSSKSARTYSYDERGNLLERRNYSNYETSNSSYTTDTFEYNNTAWPDQLTAYNGVAITYDASGNPITYGSRSYEWDMGRQLTSISYNGEKRISYTYDENGLRTSKTVGGVTTNFIYDNSLLKAQYTDDYSMLFWYDENNSPIGFVYTDKTAETPTSQTFFYGKNAFGDIKDIYDETGKWIASYTYNEWGKWVDAVWDTSEELYCFLLNNNPILYRGYYYDLETRYYYLQSRYYNPEWGRFINADDVNYIGASGNKLGVNAYLYCENNPQNHVDESGKWIQYAIAAAIGGLINVIFYCVDCNLSNTNPSLSKVLWSFLNGAINGLIAASGAKLIVQVIEGVISSLISTFISTTNPTEGELAEALIIGIVSGLIGGTISKANTKHISKLMKTFGKRVRGKLFKTGFGKTLKNGVKYVFKNSKKIIGTFLKKYILPNLSLGAASRVRKVLCI